MPTTFSACCSLGILSTKMQIRPKACSLPAKWVTRCRYPTLVQTPRVQVFRRLKMKVKVPSLTTPYSNEDCRRRGKWVWETCPESLRGSNSRPLDHNSDALPLRHRATPAACTAWILFLATGLQRSWLHTPIIVTWISVVACWLYTADEWRSVPMMTSQLELISWQSQGQWIRYLSY